MTDTKHERMIHRSDDEINIQYVRKEVTREDIENILMKDDAVVKAAILTLQARQTEDEQEAKQTMHTNERGFRQNHALRASELAEKILLDTLTPEDLGVARDIALCYAGTQLLTIMQERFEQKNK